MVTDAINKIRIEENLSTGVELSPAEIKQYWPTHLYFKLNDVHDIEIPPYKERSEDYTFEWALNQLIQLQLMSEQDKQQKLYFIISCKHYSYTQLYKLSLAMMSKLQILNSKESKIDIHFRLLGGKGGFGSMLRAQGGRMNSKTPSNNDACRDRSGRRLKTVRRAKKLVEHIELEKEREKANKERIKKKIEKGLKKRAPQKVLFDDKEYLNNSEKLQMDIKKSVGKVLASNGVKNAPKAGDKRSANIFDDEFSDSGEESDIENGSNVSESETENSIGEGKIDSEDEDEDEEMDEQDTSKEEEVDSVKRK